MVDIHNHILPQVDDGCATVNEGLNLLTELVNQGVSRFVFTPHFRKDEYEPSAQNLKQSFNAFYNEVNKIFPSVKCYLGEEIFCSFDIYNLLKQGEVLTINDTNAVLLEFNYTAPTDIADYCYNLKKMGYIPVIAHVERYEYLSVDDVVYIKDNGGLIQINASSFFENKYKKKAIDYIKYGLADFVSSDAHFNRVVYYSKSYDFVCKKFNKKIADILFKLNAEKYFNL